MMIKPEKHVEHTSTTVYQSTRLTKMLQVARAATPSSVMVYPARNQIRWYVLLLTSKLGNAHYIVLGIRLHLFGF
jgi:hypothetical protein